MKRTLLATTALAAMITTGALAQSDSSTNASQMAGSETGSRFFNEQTDTQMQSVDGYFTASPDQILASSIIGQTIYSSAGEESEAIGNVNDVIMAQDGTAEAVVIGVGGFLGIGEKEVALAFSNVNVFESEGDTWLTINAGREDLEAAPGFDRSVFEEQSATETAMQTPAEDPAVPAEGPAVDESLAIDGELGVEPTDGGANQDMSVGMSEETGIAGGDSAMQDENASSNGMNAVELDAVSASELLGARVYAENDQDIGEVGDVILSDEGAVETYIIDVGGFLGVGEKPVAMAAADLDITQDQNGWLTVHTSFSKQQLESQPAFDPQAYESDPDSVILR